MKTSILTALLALSVTLCAHAQDDLVARMNAIKLSEDYIWEQATDLNADSAIAMATVALMRQLNGDEARYELSEVKPFLRHLVMARGDQQRVFVYLKPSDLRSDPRTELITTVMKKKDIYEVWSLFEAEKTAGHIDSFGSFRDATDIGKCHLAIFDATTLTPKAVLSPEATEGKRTNLITGADDSLSNYHGVAAVWFILNE